VGASGADGLEGDLDEVIRRLTEVHPDFVEEVGEIPWAAAVEAAREEVRRADDRQDFWWAVAPLVAAAQDGHTVLWPASGDVVLPWVFDARPDGLRVVGWGGAGGPALPEGGVRLVSVEGVPADALVADLGARFGAETEGFRRYRVETEAWRALPIALEQRGVTIGDWWHLEVEDAGRTREVVVPVDPPAERRGRGWLNVWFTDAGGAVVVDGVLPGGEAARAGLRTGDVLVAVGGRPVVSRDGLSDWLAAEVGRGDVVPVQVERDGRTLELDLRAGRWHAWTAPWTLSRAGTELVVDLDSFVDPAGFEAALDAALDGGVEHVVVDLRHNDGGDAQMPEILCSRLCRTEPGGLTMTWRHSREAQRDQRHRWRPIGPLAVLFAPGGSFLGSPIGEDWPWRPDPVPLVDPPFTGRVTVLCDGGTFSAAVYAAHLLREHAGAMVVGEPPGTGPSFHAHALTDWLPDTGLALQVASATFRVRGARDPITPDVPSPSRSALSAARRGEP
jgi:C-terminal processing protease CtpA/Prc